MGHKTYGGLVAGLAIAVLAAVVSLGGASAHAAGTPPTFNNFVAPAPLGRDAGEPRPDPLHRPRDGPDVRLAAVRRLQPDGVHGQRRRELVPEPGRMRPGR